MTVGALHVSALALSAAALVLASPLSAANAATIARHYQHATHYQQAAQRPQRVAHSRVAHGAHEYVARSHAGHRHYVWRNGHRYAYGYGYNPGAAVAAGVIGGVAAGYPYSCDYYLRRVRLRRLRRLWRLRRLRAVLWRLGGFGPGFHGRHFGFHGNGARFANGNFGHSFGRPLRRIGGGTAALAAVTLAALAAATMGGFGGGHFGGGAGTSVNIRRFASPSASGGLRAARFCLAKQLGRSHCRVSRAKSASSPAFGELFGRARVS